MPEYSSTTITPSDGVQVPGMNGSTSGNFLLSALKSYILSEKGLANGLASLDGNGKLTAAQLPDLADDVIVVASYATLPAIGTAGKIYITADNNKMFRWDSDLETPDYVELSVDLSAYATKAELAEEESAREAADSNLKSAIQGNSNRISNLEEKADPTGAYKTVNYRGDNAVPTGKAKYALVESIVGKSRAWNQRINGGDFSDATLFDMVYSSLSVSDNVGTITLLSDTSSAARISKPASETSLMEDHKVLASIKIKSPKDVNCGFYIGAYWSDSVAVSANSWQTITLIMTVGNSGYDCAFGFNRNTRLAIGDTVQVKEFFVRDLTTIFPEGVPSTVAECVQKCPDILKYDAYGYSMVDTVVEGVKAIGKNLFVPSWGEAQYVTRNADGSFTMTQRESVQSPQFEVKPNTEYTLSAVLSAETRGTIVQLDANGNEIRTKNTSSWSLTETTLENARYMRMNWLPSTGQTIPVTVGNIQIEGGSTATAFSEHFESTLSLPTPITLRSAGTVADTDELNVEVLVDGQKVNRRRQTIRVGKKNLDDIQWSYLDSYGIYQGVLVGAKFVRGTSWGTSNAPYDNAGYVGSADMAEGQYQVLNDGTIWIKDANFESVRASYYLNYALATVSVTLLDPIENNTILTEGGGTINTVQTQTPVIDNSMDVGYLAL